MYCAVLRLDFAEREGYYMLWLFDMHINHLDTRVPVNVNNFQLMINILLLMSYPTSLHGYEDY